MIERNLAGSLRREAIAIQTGIGKLRMCSKICTRALEVRTKPGKTIQFAVN